MTWKDRKDEDKKTAKRMTPEDVRVRGTFAERGDSKEAGWNVRSPTHAEVRANNISRVQSCMEQFSLLTLVPMFVSDLRASNEGKRGAPFQYPDSMIVWIVSVAETCGLSLRAVAGMASGILGAFGMRAPSYSRLQERRAEPFPDLSEKALRGTRLNGVVLLTACGSISGRVRRVGIDSTGISLSKPNLWMAEKHGTEPETRWMKVHALSDVDSGEILAYALTESTVADCAMFVPLIDAAWDAGHRFSAIYGDGAYSSIENFRKVSELNVRMVASFRSNTVPKNNGCAARGEAARLWCSLPYDEWVEVTGYGIRWKVECVFSDLKRMYGESVGGIAMASQAAQVSARISEYNRHKRIRADNLGTTGNGIDIAYA